MANQHRCSKTNYDYLNQLLEEQKSLHSKNSNACKLLKREIERVRDLKFGGNDRNDSHIEVHTGKRFLLKVKVHIPVDEHPNFNFVGKLLGPKGRSFQELQEATQTKMAILGRGSMRDKKKEEVFRNSGNPKYSHLKDELHVEISVYAAPAEAYRQLSSAIAEIQRFMVPDYYDRPPQFRDMYMNVGKMRPFDGPSYMAPRGGPPRRMGPPMMDGCEPLRRPRMVQSTYAHAERDEWGGLKPFSGRVGLIAAPPAPRTGRNCSFKL